jgi:hypothetical protein
MLTIRLIISGYASSGSLNGYIHNTFTVFIQGLFAAAAFLNWQT